jgi:hypothetical protein
MDVLSHSKAFLPVLRRYIWAHAVSAGCRNLPAYLQCVNGMIMATLLWLYQRSSQTLPHHAIVLAPSGCSHLPCMLH